MEAASARAITIYLLIRLAIYLLIRLAHLCDISDISDKRGYPGLKR
jgi:hypothetical protein